MAHLKNLNRAEILRRAEAVHEGYLAGLNCAERVFLSVHSLVESVLPSQAVAMLSGMGGGMGGTHSEICGAVSGGVAAIGLIHGRPNPPEGNKKRCYDITQDFVCRFRAAHGTCRCGELIGDLLREGAPEAEERRKARCAQYTREAVRMCVETLTHAERDAVNSQR